MTEIMIKILFDVLCPLLVSVICFQIQYREQIRNDKSSYSADACSFILWKRGGMFAQGQDSCWWKNCGAHI